MFRTFGTGFISLLALAACDSSATNAQPAPGSVQTDVELSSIAPDLTGQSYTLSEEIFGYFLPYDDVAIGPIQMSSISLAMDWEIEAYMNGEPDSWPPIGVGFDDTSSPTGIGELGNTYYEVTYSLTPEIFRISDEGMAFAGQHEVLGEIRFEGQWQMDQIRQMMNGDPSSSSALTGDLKIGDVIFEGVTFQGWLGD
ncbi:MAG: hypothetical protein GC188_04775 [Alphaproteobacteria bacterium]|nr:hypothetical protein [Alphaproteobacteria bacterium]